ncbi:hypothetical protein Btru_070599 [Bulinus truncatus]|nr:hypothetical protein Btru_070599 [Bulinus truncatus]
MYHHATKRWRYCHAPCSGIFVSSGQCSMTTLGHTHLEGGLQAVDGDCAKGNCSDEDNPSPTEQYVKGWQYLKSVINMILPQVICLTTFLVLLTFDNILTNSNVAEIEKRFTYMISGKYVKVRDDLNLPITEILNSNMPFTNASFEGRITFFVRETYKGALPDEYVKEITSSKGVIRVRLYSIINRKNNIGLFIGNLTSNEVRYKGESCDEFYIERNGIFHGISSYCSTDDGRDLSVVHLIENCTHSTVTGGPGITMTFKLTKRNFIWPKYRPAKKVC